MEFSRTLPFPRGSTYSDKSLVSTAADIGSSYPGMQYAGQIYTVPDTVHKKHPFVRLRVVHNHTTALTVARKCVEFTTGAGESGRYITAITNGQGDLGKPIDDAYTVGFVIAKNDMFYVVDEGPCDVLVTASQTDAAAMSLGLVVTPDANGVLDATAAAAGDFQLGVLDEDPLTASTAYRVYVKSGLMAQEA
jgi:hypothetical protein